MSATRDALEAAQRRVRELEETRVDDQVLINLADSLEQEATAWARRVEETEQRVVTREKSGTAESVMGFGFAMVFAGPIVAMVGTVMGRAMRNEIELAVLCLVSGAAVVSLAWWKRARRAVAHRFSPEWRLLRDAREAVKALRNEIN